MSLFFVSDHIDVSDEKVTMWENAHLNVPPAKN